MAAARGALTMDFILVMQSRALVVIPFLQCHASLSGMRKRTIAAPAWASSQRFGATAQP